MAFYSSTVPHEAFETEKEATAFDRGIAYARGDYGVRKLYRQIAVELAIKVPCVDRSTLVGIAKEIETYLTAAAETGA